MSTDRRSAVEAVAHRSARGRRPTSVFSYVESKLPENTLLKSSENCLEGKLPENCLLKSSENCLSELLSENCLSEVCPSFGSPL